MESSLNESQQRVLDLLRQRGPLSRADLARESEFAAPTLSRLCHALLEHGLIQETHKVRDGQRGKPGQLIELNPDGGYAFGIALQSEYVAGCIVDLQGRTLASAMRTFDAPDPQGVRRLVPKMIESLLADSGASPSRVLGAGVSMPGMALHRYGSALRPPDMDKLPDEFAAWRSLDLEGYFRECTGLPCWLENSSTAATLAEMHFGAGQRLNHFAVLHFAYGFGGGLILQRRLYAGAFGRAGEFGGLFPYADARPSGRDLIKFLADRMPDAPRNVREIDAAPIPPALQGEWLERVYPSLHELARFLSVSLDLEGIVLNGLLPQRVLQAMAQLLRERLPRDIRAGFGVPEIVVSPLAASSLSVGAASLPLHFVTSAAWRA